MLRQVLEDDIETKHNYSVRLHLVLVIDLPVMPCPLVRTLNLTSVTDEASTDAAPRRQMEGEREREERGKETKKTAQTGMTQMQTLSTLCLDVCKRITKNKTKKKKACLAMGQWGRLALFTIQLVYFCFIAFQMFLLI